MTYEKFDAKRTLNFKRLKPGDLCHQFLRMVQSYARIWYLLACTLRNLGKRMIHCDTLVFCLLVL
jgi:hypothetical protein